jgi:DNA-binding protein
MKAKLPMHNYQLLPKKQEQSAENEIRVKSVARPFVYAAYAGKLLFEKKHNLVYLLATGQATSKVIQAVEYMRKRIGNLHVSYEIECTEFVDEYSPLVEGLEVVHITRSVPSLKANLTLVSPELIRSLPGYMAPIAPSQVIDEERFKEEIKDHFSKNRPERTEMRQNGQNGERRDRNYNNQRGPRRYNNAPRDNENVDEPRRERRNYNNNNDRQPRNNEYRGNDQTSRFDRPYESRHHDNRDSNQGHRSNYRAQRYNDNTEDQGRGRQERPERRNYNNRHEDEPRAPRTNNYAGNRNYRASEEEIDSRPKGNSSRQGNFRG